MFNQKAVITIFFLILLIVVVALQACAPISSDSTEYIKTFYPPECTMVAKNVCRVEDLDKNVVCYVYFQQAISCVKLK